MSRFKFTPGPRTVQGSQSKPAFNVIGTIVGGKYKIARCPYIVEKGDDYAKINQQEFEEAEANAKLIAAAPEMYALLLKIRKNPRLDNELSNDIDNLIKPFK